MTKEKVRVQLTRHEWPDEKEARKKKTRRNILVTLSLILVFSFGFFSHDLINTNSTQTTQTEDEFTRLKAVYSVLVDEWFFGKDNADLGTQLIDDAILGMVESTGDIHTQYMSAQEVSQFTQSIDRGFVGIGVSYFESNGTYIVENVFIDSPADKAGVQSGDIIWKVDGVDTATIDSNTLVDLVRGEEGTIVKIEFKRGDELVNLDITRGPINNTAYGKMLDSDTAYLEIYQFGTSTSSEVTQYLEEFKAANATNILIDLRDNGGGYLTSLEEMGSLFLPVGDVLIQQLTRDGQTLVSKSKGNMVMDFDQIVILINENTASAAEVFTAAIKENREATVVGVVSYGKGTVQQQYPFSDGSSLKYTVAEWLTPDGNHINGVGITPDVIVEQHPVMSRSFTPLNDGESYAYDQVHASVEDAQLSLDFLGYTVDRTDGYFSLSTQNALLAFEKDMGLSEDGLVSKEVLSSLISEVVRVWHVQNDLKDTQKIEGLKLLNE